MRSSLLAVLAILVCAPAAQAAVTVESDGGLLKVTDLVGEVNDVTVHYDADTSTALVSDAQASATTADGDCSQFGGTVLCNVTAALGLQVLLGDGDDVLQGLDWSCPAYPAECTLVYGGDGNDTLGGSGGRDIQNGGDGNDAMFGEEGRDSQTGGAGADAFEGGADFDTAYYGSIEGRSTGITVTLDDAINDGDPIFDSNGIHTDNVTSTIEEVVGTAYADTLTGTAGVQRLEGQAGNDTITGGPGADHLYGEAGDDTINAQDGEAETAVHCGADTDVANLDSVDTSAECETVNRSGGSGGGDGGGSGGGSDGGGSSGGGTTTTTPPAATPTAQPKPTRIWELPDLEPVKRKKKLSGSGKSRIYTYTKVSQIASKLHRADICTAVDSDCADDELQLDVRVVGGKSIASRYRGDAPNNVVWSQDPDGETKVSAGQKVQFFFVDPTLDNDKECDVTIGAQEVHLQIADMTFEEAAKWFKARDCKEGRDWKVVKRRTVTTLVKTSLVVGVARGGKGDNKTYDLEVWDRKAVPPCQFVRYDEPTLLNFIKSGGVRTAAEAIAFLAKYDCDSVVVRTKTTPNAYDPVVGGARKVEISSPYGDTVRFELTINQYVPVRQPGQDPTPGDPIEAKSEFCASSVSFGPVAFKGSCLKREGFTWVSTGEVTVNGLKIVPANGAAKIVLDPLNLRVAATGEASVVLDATLAGRRIGPVTLWKGRFDWVLQGGLPNIQNVFTPLGGGQTLSLPAVGRLPGLSGYGSLPKLGGLNLPNFGALDATALKALSAKVPKIDFANVEIPTAVIPDFSPQIAFTVPQGLGDFLGFPLTGEVRAKLETRNGVRGARVDVHLGLPGIFSGVSGDAGLFVGSNGTVQADAIGLKANELWVGPARMAPVEIGYDAASDRWSGNTNVTLYPGSPGFGGGFVVERGQLKQVNLSISGAVPLGPIMLNRFEGALFLDPVSARGTLAGSAGPEVPGLGPIVGLDASFDFNQAYFKVTGGVTVAGKRLADALVEYYTSGQFHARGELDYFIDANKEYGFGGVVDGWASSTAFNVEGQVAFRAKSLKLEGKGVVSSNGVAGCATVAGPLWSKVELGAGYRWGAQYIDWIGGSCDLGPYSAAVRRSAIRQAGVNTVTLPGGLGAASIAVQGTGAAPRVTLTGPKGETVTAPAGGESLQDDRFLVIQQDADDTTYVAIAQPSAGAWKVTAEPGSAPIAKILSAEALPEPKVTARVTGAGARRTLRYTVKPIPGQSVRFAEEGADLGAELGRAKGAKGALTFRPATGGAVARTIVAYVEQDGLVRTKLVVGRYRAPGGELAAPKVRAKRKGSSVSVSWTAVPGAAGYRVATTLNGRTVLATVKGRKTTVAGLLPASGAKVTVQALGGADGLGKIGKARIKAPKVRKRGR